MLAAIWAAFLLPPILRARSENRPSGSISDFRRQLHVLARSTPAGVTPIRAATPALAPRQPRTLHPPVATVRTVRRRSSVKRRRDILVGLLVAMAGSLVLGFLPPLRVLWAVHLVVDLLFVTYVALLVYLRNLAAEREMKVRFLPAQSRAAAPEPAFAYPRRSAN
ncbi:MAG TPA: hypothetical protein VHN98_06300 [Acidimicrobiales bacterium]|nr:hypothetical protein [Acidimicrobiales bacterium]